MAYLDSEAFGADEGEEAGADDGFKDRDDEEYEDVEYYQGEASSAEHPEEAANKLKSTQEELLQSRERRKDLDKFGQGAANKLRANTNNKKELERTRDKQEHQILRDRIRNNRLLASAIEQMCKASRYFREQIHRAAVLAASLQCITAERDAAQRSDAEKFMDGLSRLS